MNNELPTTSETKHREEAMRAIQHLLDAAEEIVNQEAVPKLLAWAESITTNDYGTPFETYKEHYYSMSETYKDYSDNQQSKVLPLSSCFCLPPSAAS